MRMEQLRCLVDISETKSITATAERMYVNQQTLSKSMKQLEQELGVELFVRTNRGVQLTEIAEHILEYVKQIIQAEQMIKDTCERSVQIQEELIEIKICSASVVTNIVLPSIAASFDTKHKNIVLKINSAGDIDELFRRVDTGECALGILTYNEVALNMKYEPWQEHLQVDILAIDETVVVTDRKYIKNDLEYFPSDEYFKHIKTVYDILPTDDSKQLIEKSSMATFNDADFHRKMIEKAGAVVATSGLAYRHFFSSKKYIGLPLSEYQTPIVHVVVYRKDNYARLQKLIAMIRQELHIR